jgi:acyl dehydratase
MGFNVDNLGLWTDGVDFKVDADRTIAYATATNDPTAVYLEGALAPPNFAVVPIISTGTVERAQGSVADLTVEEAMRGLHGEHDIYIHQPIRPGMVLRLKGTAIGVFGKSTGTTVITKYEMTDESGEPVNTQYMTGFFRGIMSDFSAGEAAPDHRPPAEMTATEPDFTISQRFDNNQTFRYADASGDYTPIHVDDAVAKANGLPGIIIHGLCTMAFATHAVVYGVGVAAPTSLKRFAVRFSTPALPGQEITTRIWDRGDYNGASVYVFETRNESGALVLSHGRAEVART